MIKAYLQIVIIIKVIKNSRDLKKKKRKKRPRDVKNRNKYIGKKGNPVYNYI